MPTAHRAVTGTAIGPTVAMTDTASARIPLPGGVLAVALAAFLTRAR